jgi:Domain of unknown function (DUF2382)
MAMLTEQLLGARVKSADGKAVGTVEKVFGDNGTPTWAWVRNGKAGRFVPLNSGRVTKKGLKIPYDSQMIKNAPDLDAGQRMSTAQARQLGRYFGLAVPSQRAPSAPAAKATGSAGSAPGARSAAKAATTAKARRPAKPAARAAGRARAGGSHGESLVRQEEQFEVGKKRQATGGVRLHRYVDIEPVEQTVRLVHEEYDVERLPISGSDGTHEFSEAEQEIILHEEHPVLSKKLIPVERVRLTVREVEQDESVNGEIRRERIEVEPKRRTRSARSRRSR